MVCLIGTSDNVGVHAEARGSGGMLLQTKVLEFDAV